MLQNKRLLTHLIFWTVHTVFTFFAYDLPYYDPNAPFWFIIVYLTSQLSTLLYFYTNYSIVVPRLLLKKKPLAYAFTILLCVALYILSKALIWNGFKFIDGYFLQDQKGGVVFASIFYYIISTAFGMHDHWQHSQQKTIRLQQEVNETELLYLKSQMSPHFLFNTLNNIYGLSLNNDPQTSHSISQLKDLMIYIEKFESGDKISFDQEIHYLNSFIALNRLRHVVMVDFEITKPTDSNISTIEPMIFLPFIENAFKHGEIKAESTISIYLEYSLNKVLFTIKNKISPYKRKDHVGGIGIKNIKRRLELLYPHAHELKIDETESFFTVDLTMHIG